MALVTCPDCSNQVSDSAPACPKCGRPFGAPARETATLGVPLTTTQGTSKRLKGHILISALLFWGGMLTMCSTVQSRAPGQQASASGIAVAASLAMMAGLIWYVVAKARIWWHHK